MKDMAEDKHVKQICAGLLAHVDAGKTTLSEGLLYTGGMIRNLGRVDKQDAFLELLQNSREVLQCYHVTGAYTFLVKVSCGSMAQLEHLILQFQKLGTTSTQIILSTPVNHGDLDALML